MYHYKIENYISEIASDLTNIIKVKDKILLVSPTESGKTRFVLNYINNNPNKRIGLLTPTQSLTDNIKRDSGKIRCGYGTEFIHSLGDGESFVSTWDSLANNYFIKNLRVKLPDWSKVCLTDGLIAVLKVGSLI